MNRSDRLIYKLADSPDEMEQIHRLNYETFAEEIPQHTSNPDRRLVDRFHKENTYIVAKHGGEVVGMAAVRGNRPFSLDQKLGSVEEHLPDELKKGLRLCEVRLLAVKRAYRGTRTFFGLCERIVAYCLQKGYEAALISGTDRQTRLYRHLGFRPFGPPVGTEAALFQPMYLTIENFRAASEILRQVLEKAAAAEPEAAVSFLPGPVPVKEEVKAAWAEPALSHRSDAFMAELEDVRERLKALTGALHVQVMVGTGTLANEVVAAQLSVQEGKGLILSSGEFGERLIDQADRWNLPFAALRKPWNSPVSLQEIQEVLTAHPDIRWLWTVHCETSTGYVYPLAELKRLCREKDIRLCLDACSSTGILPVDFSGVFLATSGSGKGLASYPGLAVVFHESEYPPDPRLPSYLDLGRYIRAESVPFTHSSNGVKALKAALAHHKYADAVLASRVASELTAAGLAVFRGENYSPGVLTVALPEEIPSRLFGDRLKKAGICLSYESRYLLEHNWFQVALMGQQQEDLVLTSITQIIREFRKMQAEAE